MEIKVKDTDFFWMFAHHATKFNFKELKGIIDDLYGYNYIKARVSVLPFVDNSPTSMDTIYTVLAYSRDQCIKLKQKKIFVTFDQSLYIKAREIVARYSDSSRQDNLCNVYVRLGGFHLQMSFMSAIGYTMNGSGIKSILCKIYAPNSIDKILSGHC